jgi:hypothetical protein
MNIQHGKMHLLFILKTPLSLKFYNFKLRNRSVLTSRANEMKKARDRKCERM